MAQIIAPEVWQEGVKENRLLPNRYTNTGLFIGNTGCKNIANNQEACRVYDMLISDYITDYDDRRLNGLGNVSGATGFNSDGRDGWGASAYGVFQDVRFDSRIYKMSRHRSTAMRVFEEMQRSGNIGDWGTETTNNVITTGESLKKVAQQISEAQSLWEQEVLGPEIDKYNLFAIMNGHMAGRCVGKDNRGVVGTDGINHNDHAFDGDCQHYYWVAEPGMVEGSPIKPSFAPIHCIEFDNDSIPRMLNNIKVTWNNIFLPEDNRCIIIDGMYEIEFLSVLTGNGIVTTESAYNDLVNGSFTRLMGWDFRFDIPTQYFPTLYVDANLNVVHSADGSAACDAILNSIDGLNDDGEKDVYTLQRQLVASQRMSVINYIRTEWDADQGKFVKKLTNYPLGQPAAAPWMGPAIDILPPTGGTIDDRFAQPTTYPFTGKGAGYGIPDANETTAGQTKATGPVSPITAVKVMGCFIYKKAAQLSQEYSAMRTEDGGTRGKFTEMVMEVKYDAWAIEQLSHGIIPIVKTMPDASGLAIPVSVTNMPEPSTDPAEVKVVNDDTAPVTVGGSVDAHVTNTAADPVNTKEVAASNKAKK